MTNSKRGPLIAWGVGGESPREKGEEEVVRFGLCESGGIVLRVGLAVLGRPLDEAAHVDVRRRVVAQEGVSLRGSRVPSAPRRREGTRCQTRARRAETHQQLLVRRPRVRLFPQALLHKVLRRRRVLVRQRRRVAMDDRGQLRKDVLVRLGRVRVVPARGFDHREAEGPDVGGGGVRHRRALRLALDPFRLQSAREGQRNCFGESLISLSKGRTAM